MFPSDFPQAALLEVLKGKGADAAHLTLAGYELLGYGLHLYFGDVKYLVNSDFDTIAQLAQSVELAGKVVARAKELKASGVGVFLIILKLFSEFGPVIFKLAEAIRALLKKD